MGDMAAFAGAARDTSRQLRRLPADLRRELSTSVQPEVAEPLAADIAAAYVGPWARPLAISTKARKLADPTIVVGGTRRVVSGGASARQLVYGAQWGGGQRVSNVTRRSRSGKAVRYRAHVTRQFAGRAKATIFVTIRDRTPWVLDQFATIVDRVLAGVSDD